MLISLYCINVRSQKYYIKVVFHPIDLSIVKGWVLYRRHCFQLRMEKKSILSLLQLRIAITVPKCPLQRDRLSRQILSSERSPLKKPTTVPIRLLPDSTRLNGFDHWPIQITKDHC